MAVEYEIKFKATAQTLTKIDRAITGQETIYQMETTYYDTPGGTLSSRHYTLRKRMENERAVCTLKAPAKEGRSEWEIPCEDIAEAIPQLVTLGCPADLPDLVKDGIVPICGAKFTRKAKTVSLPGGIVEIALDEGILTGGGREEPLCEVEVELKCGPVRICNLFARTLAESFPLEREEKSKFRRALALYRGE